MPLLSKFEITRQDAAGNPIVGAVIELHGKGATVVSGGPTSFTVDTPGSIRAGGAVLGVSADGLTERSGLAAVVSVTATNITVGSSISGMVNNDRLVNDTTATIRKDEAGNESAGTSLTTDSNGYASGYVNQEAFDVESTGGTSALGTAPKKYWFDIYAVGGGVIVLYDFLSASTVVRSYDSSDAAIAGMKFVRYRANGVEKWYVDLTAGLVPRIPSHAVIGPLNVESGNLVFSAAASRIVPGATSLSLRNNADSADNVLISDAGLATLRAGLVSTTGDLKATAGNLIAGRAQFTRGTALTTSDFTISAGWGAGATKAINGAAYDTCGEFQVTAAGTPAADPTLTLTFKDGTFPGAIAPNVIICRSDNAAPTTGFWIVGTRTVTSFTAKFVGTPVAASVYGMQYMVVGGFPS